MVDISWAQIDLSGDPRLVVGRRAKRKHLEANRIDVHQDAHEDLRQVAEAAVHVLATTRRRAYEPFAELEIDEEHFEAQLGPASADVEGDVDAEGEVDVDVDADAELPRLIEIADELDAADARDLRDAPNLFYALCWPTGTGMIGFVKQADPVRILRSGRRFFQYQDALRSVQTPDFALEASIDFVVHAGTVAILRPTPFRNLFTDVDVALTSVPTYIAGTRAALASTAPLTDSSAAALQAVVSRRVTYASRLKRLAERLNEMPLTAASIRAAAARHLDDPRAVIDDSGQLTFDEEHVGDLLDLLEGRLFEDDFSGQRRRADRFSTR